MPHYKDKQNKIYFLDDAKDYYYLPVGSTPINEAEADIIRAPTPLTTTQKRALLKPLSPAQIRLVLNRFGLLAQVEAAVALGDKTMQIEWEFADEFSRTNVTLLSVLGMSDAQLDSMFEIGITL